MKAGFRSRGIRIIKDLPITSYTGLATSKVYYEANSLLLKQPQLQKYITDDTLSYFEHSIDVNGNIDTFNFHVNLNKKSHNLYDNLPITALNLIYDIPNIFDETFLNYTVGYRVRNNYIIDKTFYFYPTIPKENRIGLKGITDINVIKKYINSFINYLGINDEEVKSEIENFVHLMYKFKGIGLTVFQNHEIDFKIYGKIHSNDIYDYVSHKAIFDTDQFKIYGDVILTAQRISNKIISGYNLYYSK